MGYSFKVEGLTNLKQKIEEKRQEIGKVFEKRLQEGADDVLAGARSRAPVGVTEHLVSSLAENEVWERGGKYSIYVGIEVNSTFTQADGWYARMQETGTTKMRAHPYLRPAFDSEKKGINDNIVSDLKEVINEGGV